MENFGMISYLAAISHNYFFYVASIKKRLSLYNLTQKQLAQFLYIDASNLSKILSLKNKPSLWFMFGVEAFFSIYRGSYPPSGLFLDFLKSLE